jgi:hypothetical protein
LYTLKPLDFPGFAFSWLQLFSHRLYLPLLFTPEPLHHQGQTICYQLMTEHLSFLNQLLKHRHTRRLLQSEKAFYQGTLRFLVVMLHDYPEFLCEHYLSFIQLLPVDCIQLRNVILSSFPRSMILPDPFTTTLGYMASNTTAPPLQLEENDVFHFLHAYLTTGKSSSSQSVGHLLMQYLMQDQQKIDPEKLQQLIFYVGTQTKLDTTKSLSENAAVQIYKYLLTHCVRDHDRYLLINALVDHLRYPNSHTYFFGMTLLHLFASQPETIKELITRVLLERLIVNRPHPWGLLTTFIQLIKEPQFTDHNFIKSSMSYSPDIKRLFENVLK